LLGPKLVAPGLVLIHIGFTSLMKLQTYTMTNNIKQQKINSSQLNTLNLLN